MAVGHVFAVSPAVVSMQSLLRLDTASCKAVAAWHVEVSLTAVLSLGGLLVRLGTL